jgi:pseudouridine kinase
MKKRVTVIGGMNMDIKAKSKNKLLAGDSNPSIIEISAGGVGRNIAHNLALLGIETTLLSAAGRDRESSEIIQQTAEAGVITEHILFSQTKKIGKYIAILDAQGEMAMAVSDMEVLEELNRTYLEEKKEVLLQSDLVVCDTNLSEECLAYIADVCRASAIPLCVDPVSAAKAVKLKGILKGISILTPNLMELQILSGREDGIEEAAQELTRMGVQNVITTLGARGLCHTDANKSTCYSSIAKDIVDVTGAGDSLTAGLIYGLLTYQSYEKACQWGLAAAALTLSSKETVNRNMSQEQVEKLLLD